jgi:hypothetical protein
MNVIKLVDFYPLVPGSFRHTFHHPLEPQTSFLGIVMDCSFKTIIHFHFPQSPVSLNLLHLQNATWRRAAFILSFKVSLPLSIKMLSFARKWTVLESLMVAPEQRGTSQIANRSLPKDASHVCEMLPPIEWSCTE